MWKLRITEDKMSADNEWEIKFVTEKGYRICTDH